MLRVTGRGVRAADFWCARALGTLLALSALFTQPVLAQNPDAQARYREGTRAIAEHRYAAARVALAEAVRLDPDFAGAWLDLALATYAAGDLVQAEEFLDTLEIRFDVPPRLAALIADLRREIHARPAQDAPVSAWRWRRRVEAAVGHDSNANVGLARDQLTLTFPGGSVVLPLTREVRPRADGFAQTALALAATRASGDDALEFTASLRGRRNATETAFDIFELRGGIAWSSGAPLPAHGLGGLLPGPWRLHADFEQLRLGGNALIDRAVLRAEHLWPALPCRPQAGVDLELRTYPVARTLDATYLWLDGALRCPGLLGPASREFALQLRVGHAAARHGAGSSSARPGGDTQHIELAAAQEWAWASAAGTQTLRAHAQWERARDTDGYSPLLADNARRVIDSTTLGISWSIPLPLGTKAGWQAIVAAQQFRQKSNLRPFSLSGRTVQLGVERHW